MSEAPTPAAEVEAAAPAAETALTGDAGGQQKSSDAGQGDAPKGDGQGAGSEKPADAGAPAQGEKPKDGEGGEAQGAPEAYADFTVPEGIELAGDMLADVTALAKAHNLNQAQAQALVDLGVKQAQTIADTYLRQVTETPVPLSAHWGKTWSEQTTADAEIGGDKLQGTMALATSVFATFASPELGKFLNETGLAHHPELIRFMNKVGKAVSEDTLVVPSGGQGSKTPTGRDPARKLYPGMA